MRLGALLIGCAGCAGAPSSTTDTGDTGDTAADNTGIPWIDIAASSTYSCGVRANHAVECWGSGAWDTGYYPSPDRVVTHSPLEHDFVDVELAEVEFWDGNASACALRISGSLHCWGQGGGRDLKGEYIQTDLGFGALLARNVRNELECRNLDGEPCREFTRLTKVATFSAGRTEYLAVLEDGELAGGDHYADEWDDGFSVELPPGPWIRVAAPSETHGCGVRADGSISCFGDEGTSRFFDTPAGTFVDLCIDDEKSGCGLAVDGNVVCWGTDAPVPEVGPFVQLACGDGTYCGRTADGQARCWGHCFVGNCQIPR